MDRGALGGGGGRAEAASLLDVAKKLLDARDLVGSKTFAERAMEADPLVDGLDWVMATADVLLAAQRRRVNNHADLYALLQVDPSPAGRASPAVRLQYSRLARLLHPRHRQGSHGFQSFSLSSAADEAFRFVCDAWAVLSDPAKKELYDKEIDLAGAAQQQPNGGSAGADAGAGDKPPAVSEADAGGAFWTACTGCFKVHQYARRYEGRTLVCQNCRKEFQAAEMASPPPIVPGMDMYFCAWGLYPLGFPGGPKFACPSGVSCAGGPWVGDHAPGEPWKQNGASSEAAGMPPAPGKSPKKTRNKLMAKRPRKQVRGGGGRGIGSAGEAGMVVDARNRESAGIREGVGARSAEGGSGVPRAGCSRAVEVSSEDLDLNFTIDIDATNSILESLSTLPFLKDEEIVVCGKMPGHYKGNV